MSFTSISSASLVVTQTPQPLTDLQQGGTVMVLSCTGMKAHGDILLGGNPGAPPFAGERKLSRIGPDPGRIGWRAGWVQLFFQEQVRGIWTSPDPAFGGLLEEHDSFKALDGGDDVATEFFCSRKPGFYHLFSPDQPNAQLDFIDIPIHYFPMTKTAPPGKGTAPFRLASVKLRFSFILALVARDPENDFHVLKSVPWTFHLQYRRSQLGKGSGFETWALVPAGTQGTAGNATSGAPQQLVTLLQNPPRKSANQLASAPPKVQVLSPLELKPQL